MLNNLYRPLEEGTHTYSQIDDHLSKRYLDSIDKMSELQKRFHNIMESYLPMNLLNRINVTMHFVVKLVK